jgi:hypothetical protein
MLLNMSPIEAQNIISEFTSSNHKKKKNLIALPAIIADFIVGMSK